MEGNKKRWRPSLADYRELGERLESQVEGTSMLVGECDAWREKYRCLKAKCDLLDKSNSLMENELDRLRASNEALLSEGHSLKGELERLASRGFWARVFNRK